MKIMTKDQLNANLVYAINQLENLDPILHKPLVNYTWGRDIDLRQSIDIADETISFIRQGFSFSSDNSSQLPYISQNATDLSGVSISGEKVQHSLYLLGKEISLNAVDIAKAQKANVALETSFHEALQAHYNLSIDQMVYVGDKTRDTATEKVRGILNNDEVEKTKLTGSDIIAEADGDKILKLFNDLMQSVWSKTNYNVLPNHILMPTTVYAKLATTRYGSNADKTLLQFLKDNCLATSEGQSVQFLPCEWCNTAGADGHGRLVAYNKNTKFVRLPLAPIQRQESYIDGLYIKTPYLWKQGTPEIIYEETFAYMDGVTNTGRKK